MPGADRPGRAWRNSHNPVPSHWDVVLPHGAQIHASVHLVSWHPTGRLDAALADEILRFIEVEEATAAEPFHRFADLSGLDAIHLSSAELEGMAARRIGSYHGPPVKSAILALNPLAFGVAQMYERLMRRSPIEVRVFCRLTSAAIWLKISTEVLATMR